MKYKCNILLNKLVLLTVVIATLINQYTLIGYAKDKPKRELSMHDTGKVCFIGDSRTVSLFYDNYWEHENDNPINGVEYDGIDVYAMSGADFSWLELCYESTNHFEKYNTICCWLGVNDIDGTSPWRNAKQPLWSLDERISDYIGIYNSLLEEGKNVIIFNVANAIPVKTWKQYCSRNGIPEDTPEYSSYNELDEGKPYNDDQKFYHTDILTSKSISVWNKALKQYVSEHESSEGKLKYVDTYTKVCYTGNRGNSGLWYLDTDTKHFAERENNANLNPKTINKIWQYMLQNINFKEGTYN